jgi:hypothetical protein
LGHTNIPEPELYHQGITQVLNNCPEVAGYFKFGFVRNPWARILSLYQDFTKKRIHQYSALVRHDKPLFSEFAGFEDFCLRVGNSPWMEDIFFQSQAKLLDEANHTMDYIGRFEQLDTDFAEVCDKLGLNDIQLESHNIGVYEGDYHQHYTSQAADAIGKLYADDAELFEYEF